MPLVHAALPRRRAQLPRVRKVREPSLAATRLTASGTQPRELPDAVPTPRSFDQRSALLGTAYFSERKVNAAPCALGTQRYSESHEDDGSGSRVLHLGLHDGCAPRAACGRSVVRSLPGAQSLGSPLDRLARYRMRSGPRARHGAQGSAAGGGVTAKKKASGRNIPEAERGTIQVKLRLPEDVAEDLDTLAARWGVTRSGAVAMLVERALESNSVGSSSKSDAQK